MIDNFIGSAAPLTAQGVNDVIAGLGIDGPSLWSLVTVETKGCGFFADKRPQILFERHVFHERTQGRFDAQAPELSSKTRGGYEGGTAEYARLARAMTLDARAALESSSWGLGQVMGFHATRLRYGTVEGMVAAFLAGEDAQLDAVARFIAATPALASAFKNKQWAKVALLYNGSDFAKNAYDVKLAQFHDDYAQKGTPDVEIRAAQVRLTYLHFNPKGIDGVLGPGTRAALLAFKKTRGLPETPDLDAATQDALKRAAGV